MGILNHVLGDVRLKAELDKLVLNGHALPRAHLGNVSNHNFKAVIERVGNLEGVGDTHPWTEAVILEYARPVLFIRNNRFEVPASEELAKRLLSYKPIIERHIPAVGRIEFKGHPGKRWGGTGWIVADGVIATNRHVAEEFASRRNGTIEFIKNFAGDNIQARLDFLEEAGSDPKVHEHEILVEQVLFLQDQDQTLPDVALLKLAQHGTLPPPIPLQTERLKDRLDIAVIGYPAKDFRGVANAEAAQRIFGDIYEVKRLAPGQVMIANDDEWYFTHDATTLGGCSGSVVIDISTGGAVGMHFQGELHKANYAVKASALLECLRTASILVPEIPQVVTASAVLPGEPEGTVEDYSDRDGYLENFLSDDDGEQFLVPLPEVIDPEHLLRVDEHGKEDPTGDPILRYQHFSVAMNKERRMCYYSAVNIHGRLSKKGFKRARWRHDPRVPDKYRPEEQCYGDPPQFSRGHMTRREDPIWGNNDEEAAQGNEDSMHYTNVTPQMQPFNSPVWLGLENYALDNARQDKARISVFTGPIFTDDDPLRYKVRIPVRFWKVIAFIHDDTDQLCATGYIMSQEDYLVNEESVYGPYVINDENYQVPIHYIESETGLSFGSLRDKDPMQNDPFTKEAIPDKLLSVEQIRFT